MKVETRRQWNYFVRINTNSFGYAAVRAYDIYMYVHNTRVAAQRCYKRSKLGDGGTAKTNRLVN